MNYTNFNVVHSKLEQYVVRLDISNLFVIAQKKADYLSTYGFMRTLKSVARDSNAVHWSVAGEMKVLQLI